MERLALFVAMIASLKAILVRARSVLIAPGVARLLKHISNWQIAIGQMVESYFFLLSLRGTGDFVWASCFSRSLEYRVFLPLAILGRSWRTCSISASVHMWTTRR